MRTVMAVLGLVASLAAIAPPAAADDDEVVRQLADQSFKSGVSWFKKGDFQRAMVEFKKANAVYPRGSTMRNLGLCELKLGKPLDALKDFRAALAAPDTKPEQRDLARQDIEDAYALTGHILVHSNDGATISLDGRDTGAVTKDPIDVLPGPHVIEAHVGTQTVKANVTAMPGAVAVAEVSVAPTPVAPTPAAPPLAASPAASQPAPEGPPPSAEAPSFWTTRREIGVGVAGLGVVSLVLAEFFHTKAQAEQSNAASASGGLSSSACSAGAPSASCSSLSADLGNQQSDATWETTFLITGGVGLAAGAALFLWPQPSSSSARAAITPFATPHGSGLQLRGEF